MSLWSMFCVDAHFADEKTEVHGAAFNYLARVTQPREWWSQHWKPGSQTPECKLLANWKAYVEHLQYSTHCTRPFNSLASFSAFANLMGYVFIPSLLWVSRLRIRELNDPRPHNRQLWERKHVWGTVRGTPKLPSQTSRWAVPPSLVHSSPDP